MFTLVSPLLVHTDLLYVLKILGDVLEWITWGGGGLGDPLARPASVVAREVHRRLVSVAGAANNYGVVVNRDFSVNEGATTELRRVMREKRTIKENSKIHINGDREGGDAVGYDRGGTMCELVKMCKQDTGLEPPQPQWEKDPYGPHTGLPYVKEWYRKMREGGLGVWDLV